MNQNTSSAPTGSIPEAEAPKYPRGLYTLFFTEMWERFSYYGMRALLVLFMVDTVQHGGLGLSDKTATAIYGLYTAGVYLMALPGGWVADRLLGAQRAVWYGGIVITAGHFSLAIPSTATFYLGLLLLVLGTGLLKPNISAIVGQLYPEGGARRDAGFTIFYMGINLGATLGPLVCSALGEKVNWHYGFGAAGIGMILGLVQYKLTAPHLGEAGKRPGHAEPAGARHWGILWVGLAAVAVLVVLIWTGIVVPDPLAIARNTTAFILSLAGLYFTYLLLFSDLTGPEKKRIGVVLVLFISSAMFWSGFEQAGSSLNIFADRYTQRVFSGHEIPAGWFQSLNPAFIISLAPLVASLWLALSRRGRDIPLPLKFAVGLVLLGLGFLVMAIASKTALASGRVWPTWLILTYFLHSVGELFLSPVGLSSVTKLAPLRLSGQMMGIWFLATSLGNLMAGLIAGEVSGDSAGQMPARFMQIVLSTCGTAVLLAILARPIQRLMGGVK